VDFDELMKNLGLTFEMETKVDRMDVTVFGSLGRSFVTGRRETTIVVHGASSGDFTVEGNSEADAQAQVLMRLVTGGWL